MPRGFRSCVPFRKPLGRHRRRLRQITAPLIPAFQSLTSAAARENPWNRGSVAKVGIAWGFTGMFLRAPAASVGWTLMRYWLDESRDQEAVDAQLAVMSSPTRPETDGR